MVPASGKRILHLTADYPDPLQHAKTKAIFNLLQLADIHTHNIYSLNRVNWRAGIQFLSFNDDNGSEHRAIAYGAPPRGFFLVKFLRKLSDWIAADCISAGRLPDVIHAHKLTIEGIVAERLGMRLGVPVILSIQGNTDLKIVNARRDLRAQYARLWKNTKIVFPFAPWAKAQLDDLLGIRSGRTTLLPCPGPADDVLPPKVSDVPIIRTAFNLRDSANKNAVRMINALAIASAKIPNLQIEFIGGGDPSWFSQLSRIADDIAPGRVRFRGPIPNTDVQKCFNEAAAFALVSHRESYGMVFAEALLAGTPCLVPRGRGIDGYFDEGSVILSADPNDEAEIASAFVRLIQEQVEFKMRLAAYGESGQLEILRRPAIRERYLTELENLDSPRPEDRLG